MKSLSKEDNEFISSYVSNIKISPHQHYSKQFELLLSISSHIVYYPNIFKISSLVKRIKYDDVPVCVYDDIGSNRSIIAFSGTCKLSQWIRNIETFFFKSMWHFELKRVIKSVIEYIKRDMTREYYVTGHSAGGFIAQYCSMKFCLSGTSYSALPLYCENPVFSMINPFFF